MQRPARSRSRSQERGKLAKFILHKLGPHLSDLEVKSHFCQFGEVQLVNNYGGNPQKVYVELKLANTPIEELLAYTNTHFRSKGWNLTETGKESMHPQLPAQPQQMGHTGQPGSMYQYQMGMHGMMGGVPMFHPHNPLSAPTFHNAHAMHGAVPSQPPRQQSQPGMMMSSQGQYMPQNHMMRVAPPIMKPAPPVSQPQPSRAPPPVEDKVEATPQVMNNLKALKSPDRIMELLKLEPDVVQKLILDMANKNHLSLVVHNIKVREIWVGNLVEETTEQDVRNAFSMYGKIENVEMFKKPNQIFAFLKYFKVSQAAKAFENIDNLSVIMRLNLRISYSDFSKRNSIVGDNPQIEDNLEELTPYLFLAYNSGSHLPKIKYLKRRLAEFGQVKDILMKPSYNSNFKSFVVIEFETVEQAVKARKYYFLNEKSAKRRFRLGTRDIDINVLIRVPDMRKFEITSQMIKVGPSQTGSSLNSTILARLKGKTVSEEIQHIFRPIEEKRKDEIEEEPLLNKMQSTNIKMMEEYIENKKLSARYDLTWSGTVYRGKKKHFFTDVLYVSGDKELPIAMPERLIMSHKTSFKDALSRKRLAICAFVPGNRVAYPEFMEMLRSFQDGDMVGATFQIKKYIVYLVPYHDKMRELIPELDPASFVGIFTEKGDTDTDDSIPRLAEENEEVCVLDDKKDRVMQRHDSKQEHDYNSDSEDNYSDSADMQDSPEESDNETSK